MILGIGLWLAFEIVVALIVMGVIVSIDWPIRALVWAIVAIAGIAWLNGIDVLGWIASNPNTIIGGLAAWVFIGGASAVFFWNRYLNSEEVVNKVAYARRQWEAEKRTGPELPPFVDSYHFKQLFGLDKDMWRIANWVIWWPFKWASYLLGGFLVDLVRWVAKRVAGLFSHMARNRFK